VLNESPVGAKGYTEPAAEGFGRNHAAHSRELVDRRPSGYDLPEVIVESLSIPGVASRILGPRLFT